MQDAPEELAARIDALLKQSSVTVDLDADELAGQAELAIELSSIFTDRSAAFASFAKECDYAFDEWLLNLPASLARAGLVDTALEVADAMVAVDKEQAADYACEAATILAEAGRRGEAKDRIQQNLSRFGDSPYTWMAAGEAWAALGERQAALLAYEQAVTVAADREEPSEVADTTWHLTRFIDEHPELGPDVVKPHTRVQILSTSGGQVVRATTTVTAGFPKVGRNEPCPCGSGRKYKRCCASVS